MRAQRPSLTAAKVARSLVYAVQDPRFRKLLPAGAAELNEELSIQAGILKPFHVKLFRKRWFKSYVDFVIRHTVPGQMTNVLVRKRFVDDEARDALQKGARQLLMVGAGYDTLCLRLAPLFESIPFFELDHPSTQRVKRAAVEALGRMRSNLHFLGVDLSRTRLASALESTATWDARARSVVVAEGVLMYLSESDVVSFLEQVCACSGRESRLVFTHMRTDESGRPYLGKVSWLFRAPLALHGESMRWAIPRERLGTFLSEHGYELEKAPGEGELRKLYLEPLCLGGEGLGDFEFLASARTIGLADT